MFSLPHPTDVQLVFIALVSIGSTARMARLLIHDHWPPVSWLRRQWDNLVPERTDKDGWNLLLHCHYCISVWLSFGVIAWGFLTEWNLWWWLFNAPLAVAYLAAILVTYDGNDDE